MAHKYMEELCLNHWPSLSTLFYDGWVLRFANGYTKRANSISPIYGASDDPLETIAACERLYAAQSLPTIFKITPFVQPANLDRILAERGYSLADLTSIQTLSLDRLGEPEPAAVTIREAPDAEWIEHYCRLSHIGESSKIVMQRMLANIQTQTGFILYYDAGHVVACGFGVIERDYMGLYDIVTGANCRNRGFGERMIRHLLKWGRESGAKYSYLAVVADNVPAVKLYAKIGYSEIYTYWYRIKGSRQPA